MSRRRPSRAIPGLENKLQSELDEPWVCAGVNTGYLAKRGAANGSIGRSPLGAIEQIEEFGSEGDTEPLIRAKGGPLEKRKVPIVYAGRAQGRVGASLISIREISRRRKTCCIEPLVQFHSSCRRGFLAASSVGRRRAATERGSVVGDGIAERKREALLEDSHTVNSPTTDDLIQGAGRVRKVLFPMAQWKIENVADDEALRNVLGGQRALSTVVVIVLNAAVGCLEPIRQGVCVA